MSCRLRTGTNQRGWTETHKKECLLMRFYWRGEKIGATLKWPQSWWRPHWRIRFSPRIEYCNPQNRELLSEPSHINANRLIEKEFEFGAAAVSCLNWSSGRGPLSKLQHTGTTLILRGNWDYPPRSYCALVVNSQYRKCLSIRLTLLLWNKLTWFKQIGFGRDWSTMELALSYTVIIFRLYMHPDNN